MPSLIDFYHNNQLVCLVQQSIKGGFVTQLDKETLTHLTRLCHIHCSAEELERFLGHLQSILNYIEQLKEVDTDNVAISTHITEHVQTVMREDVIEASLDRDLFLKNAPSHIGGMVRVPTVIQF